MWEIIFRDGNGVNEMQADGKTVWLLARSVDGTEVVSR